MRIDVDEALRYLGARRAGAGVRDQVARTARQLEARLSPRWVFREFAVEHTAAGPCLPDAALDFSGALAVRMLAGCDRAALLVCTLGTAFDALLRAAQARDMSEAVVLDACGSAYAEAGCDEAQRRIAALHPGLFLTDRFSPGYGDLPLSLQPALLAATDAARRLGVQATDSFLLIPAKTVTAVIGLSGRPQPARIRGCAYCDLRENCSLREGGESCAEP